MNQSSSLEQTADDTASANVRHGNLRLKLHLGLEDCVLPRFRVAMYEVLAQRMDGRFSIFTGISPGDYGVEPSETLAESAECTSGPNVHLSRGATELIYQRGFPDWLRNTRPDALIMSANARIISNWWGSRWCRRNNIPVLGWGLGTLMLAKGLAKLRTYGRRAHLSRFDSIIAYSSRAKREYEELGIDPDRVFVVNNAVKRCPTGPPPERHGLVDGRLQLITVGRLYEGKRLPVLLKALSKMDSKKRPFLHVVGDGVSRESDEALAGELIPGSFQFHGALYGEDLEQAFARADLFVLPGLGGLAVQEAMYHGLPVIVGDSDGTQDDLVSPNNGWIVAPGDETQLRDAIEVATSDLDKLRSMGIESRRMVQEEINLDRMMDQLVHAVQVTKDRHDADRQ